MPVGLHGSRWVPDGFGDLGDLWGIGSFERNSQKTSLELWLGFRACG